MRTAQRELETERGPEDLLVEKGDRVIAPLPSTSTGMVTRSRGAERSGVLTMAEVTITTKRPLKKAKVSYTWFEVSKFPLKDQ